MESSRQHCPVPERDSLDRTGFLVLATLCCAMFAGGINAIGLGPFLVDIGADLGTSVPAVGQAVTVTLLMSAAAGIIIGPVADHFGHRRLMMLGALVLAISALGTALAVNYGMFMGVRMIGGASFALLNGLSLAIAGSYFTGEARRRALSVTVAAMSGVAIIGVPALSWIGDFAGWRWAFASVGVSALLLVPLLGVMIPITAPSSGSFALRQLWTSYRPLFSQRAIMAVYLGSFLRAIFWLGILTYFGAFLIERYGLSLQQVGLTYLVGGVGFLLGSILAGGRFGGYEPRRSFAVATVIGAILFGLAYITPFGAVGAVLLLSAGGCFGAIGWVVLNTLLANESTAGIGTTMSLNTAIFNLGSAAGGAVGGLLIYFGGYEALGIGLPLFALVSSVIVWRSGSKVGEPTPAVARSHRA